MKNLFSERDKFHVNIRKQTDESKLLSLRKNRLETLVTPESVLFVF